MMKINTGTKTGAEGLKTNSLAVAFNLDPDVGGRTGGTIGATKGIGAISVYK